MASPPVTDDEAYANRIISHMQASHSRSLSLYLQHYLHLPASSTRTCDLISITLSSLSILYFPKQYGIFPVPTLATIPLSPPLASWAEARTRFVDMDRECRRELGISQLDLSGEQFVPPTTTLHVMVFAAALWLYFSLGMQALGFFGEGSWWYGWVLRWWPLGGADGYLWVQKVIWFPVVVLHLAEAVWMASKLKHFGVGEGRYPMTWYAWVGSTFVEGYGAHLRFTDLVRKKERQAEMRKH